MDKLKEGYCIVIGCLNASAPGLNVCHPTDCLDNEWSQEDDDERLVF